MHTRIENQRIMDVKELKEKIANDEIKIVVAKKKKRGYTVYPQVVDVIETVVPYVGQCYAVIFEG